MGKKMSNEQPDALLYTDKLRDMCAKFKTPSHERGVINGAIQELRRQHARIAELEAALAVAQASDTGNPVSESDVPVPLPEPDAYLYTNGNHRGVSLEWRAQSDMAEGTERHALYTEKQVRAMLLTSDKPRAVDSTLEKNQAGGEE